MDDVSYEVNGTRRNYLLVELPNDAIYNWHDSHTMSLPGDMTDPLQKTCIESRMAQIPTALRLM